MRFLQNYDWAPVSRLHSSSTSALSFVYYFILIRAWFSSTLLNRGHLCEVDLSSVIVIKGISVGISSARLIAKGVAIKNRMAGYFNPHNDPNNLSISLSV